MVKSKFKIITLLFAFMMVWSIPSFAGDHAIQVSWQPVTTTVVNGDCTQTGEAVAKVVGYTVRYRKVGDTQWKPVEAGSAVSLEVGGLEGETTYEGNVGSHYAGEPVLCWSDQTFSVTTPADQPPKPCESVSATVVR